jgi:hypothetical protein
MDAFTFYRAWMWIQPAFQAAVVTIEVTIVGIVVSWLQLSYMKNRDKELDARGSWAETHRLMMIFRFKRELLNQANIAYPASAENAINALESLHVLKGQLDRMRDDPLVKELAGFLHENELASNWRDKPFEEKFDEYAHKAALRSRPPKRK